MDAWFECATALKDYDEDKIRGWKEEIDTQLVFVCLNPLINIPRAECTDSQLNRQLSFQLS